MCVKEEPEYYKLVLNILYMTNFGSFNKILLINTSGFLNFWSRGINRPLTENSIKKTDGH